jgi:hypothetical protein
MIGQSPKELYPQAERSSQIISIYLTYSRHCDLHKVAAQLKYLPGFHIGTMCMCEPVRIARPGNPIL